MDRAPADGVDEQGDLPAPVALDQEEVALDERVAAPESRVPGWSRGCDSVSSGMEPAAVRHRGRAGCEDGRSRSAPRAWPTRTIERPMGAEQRTRRRSDERLPSSRRADARRPRATCRRDASCASIRAYLSYDMRDGLQCRDVCQMGCISRFGVRVAVSRRHRRPPPRRRRRGTGRSRS